MYSVCKILPDIELFYSLLVKKMYPVCKMVPDIEQFYSSSLVK
jgi:hypothetical protein